MHLEIKHIKTVPTKKVMNKMTSGQTDTNTEKGADIDGAAQIEEMSKGVRGKKKLFTTVAMNTSYFQVSLNSWADIRCSRPATEQEKMY